MTWMIFVYPNDLGNFHLDLKSILFIESVWKYDHPLSYQKGIYQGYQNAYIYIYMYNPTFPSPPSDPGRSIEAGIGVGVGLSEAAKISPV